MYDDGAHNDGTANDDVYGANVQMNGAYMQYYIYAENANTGAFSPERAEHEFYSLTGTATTATASQVLINELTANNNTGIQNEKGKFKDWVELYNATFQPLSLSGLYLSDSIGDLTKWAFPSDAIILPGQHLLLWADDEDETYVEMHTNFNLSNTADALILSDGVSVFDSISYGNQAPDAGLARCADGVGNFVSITDRTPRGVNSCSSSVSDVNDLQLLLMPNPASSVLHVLTDEEIVSAEIISLHGERVLSAREKKIDVSQLSSGCYLVMVTSAQNKIWRGKVIKY